MPGLAGTATTATPAELETARDDALGAVRVRLHGFLAEGGESEVADDLTPEVLPRLLQHQGSAVENPTAWLYRVARNVLIDHYRSRSSHQRLHTADLAAPPMALAEEPFADDPRSRTTRTGRLPAFPRRRAGEPTARQSPSSTSTADPDRGRPAPGLSVSGMKSRVQRDVASCVSC